MVYAKQLDNSDSCSLFFRKNNKTNRTTFTDYIWNENVIIYGNRDYNGIFNKDFEKILNIATLDYEIQVLLEDKKSDEDFKDFIYRYLAPNKQFKAAYNEDDIKAWRKVLVDYITHWRIDKNIILSALKLITGKTWNQKFIYGYMQGEWMEMYYSSDITSKEAEFIESVYFGKGNDYLVYEEGDEENADVIYVADHENTKEVIASTMGVLPNEVKLLVITGYIQVPQYEEAED